MIVLDPRLFYASVGPPEDNPPLFVNPDGVISFQVSLESLQAITRGASQVLEVRRIMKNVEFPSGDNRDSLPAGFPLHLPGKEELLSCRVSEGLNCHDDP
jgi:hypothetical protein